MFFQTHDKVQFLLERTQIVDRCIIVITVYFQKKRAQPLDEVVRKIHWKSFVSWLAVTHVLITGWNIAPVGSLGGTWFAKIRSKADFTVEDIYFFVTNISEGTKNSKFYVNWTWQHLTET